VLYVILVAPLFLLWLIINLVIIIPKGLTKEEILFLFLSGSIIIMSLVYFPAAKAYHGDHGFRLSRPEIIAFLINRNGIFPLAVVLFFNGLSRRPAGRKGLFAAVFLIGLYLYLKVDQRYTTVTPVFPLIVVIALFFLLMAALLKGFRILRNSEPADSRCGRDLK
jgi:hypothetical protein